MKLLLDSCVWGGAVGRLQAAGHDVVWSGDWPADPGDEEILARALAEGRVLVTLDKDFGDLAILRGLPHAVQVLNRVHRAGASAPGPETVPVDDS